MISDEDLLILKHLRSNARKKIVDISAETGMPVSTVFEKARKIEKKYVKRFTCLLDFSKMNYSIKACFVLKTDKKEEVESFLMRNPHVNSLLKTRDSSDFFCECVFRNINEMEDFKTALCMFNPELKEFHVLEELKQEGFLVE